MRASAVVAGLLPLMAGSQQQLNGFPEPHGHCFVVSLVSCSMGIPVLIQTVLVRTVIYYK